MQKDKSKNNKPQHMTHTSYKTWIIDQNVKHKTVKYVIGENLHDFGNQFLETAPTATSMKENINKIDINKNLKINLQKILLRE